MSGGIFGSRGGIFDGGLDALGDADSVAATPAPGMSTALAVSPRRSLMPAQPTLRTASPGFMRRTVMLPLAPTLHDAALSLGPLVQIPIDGKGIPHIGLERRTIWFVSPEGAQLLDAALSQMAAVDYWMSKPTVAWQANLVAGTVPLTAAGAVQHGLNDGKATLVDVASLTSGSAVRLLTTNDPEEIWLRTKPQDGAPDTPAPYAVLHGPAELVARGSKPPMSKWVWLGIGALALSALWYFYDRSRVVSTPNPSRWTKRRALPNGRRKSMGWARDEARGEGFDLGRDYYTLSSSEKSDLKAIMRKTSFRQSSSSKAMGRTALYQFWLGLQTPVFPQSHLPSGVRAAVTRRSRSGRSKYRLKPNPRRIVKVEDRDDGEVMVSVSGPGALGWAKHQQSIGGSHWEGADGDDFAYTILYNHAGLVDELRKEGYKLDLSEYTAP